MANVVSRSSSSPITPSPLARVAPQRVRANAHPDDVDDRGRDCAIPSSVTHQTNGATDIEELIRCGSTVELVHGKEPVREEHQCGSDPPDDLDDRLHGPMIVSARCKSRSWIGTTGSRPS